MYQQISLAFVLGTYRQKKNSINYTTKKQNCYKRFPMFGNIRISKINATKGYHTFRLALHKGQRLLSQYNDCGSTPHRLCVASCKLHYFRNRLEIRPNDSVAMNLVDLKTLCISGICTPLELCRYFYNLITRDLQTLTINCFEIGCFRNLVHCDCSFFQIMKRVFWLRGDLRK